MVTRIVGIASAKVPRAHFFPLCRRSWGRMGCSRRFLQVCASFREASCRTGDSLLNHLFPRTGLGARFRVVSSPRERVQNEFATAVERPIIRDRGLGFRRPGRSHQRDEWRSLISPCGRGDGRRSVDRAPRPAWPLPPYPRSAPPRLSGSQPLADRLQFSPTYRARASHEVARESALTGHTGRATVVSRPKVAVASCQSRDSRLF